MRTALLTMPPGVFESIIDGYPDGTFRPGDNINYAEAAKIIANGFLLDLGIEQGEWYLPYTNALNDYGAKPERRDRRDGPALGGCGYARDLYGGVCRRRRPLDVARRE